MDSEELAGRLEAAGWTLTDRDEAAVVLVNTCGFIEAAKQESIAELLDASGSPAKVVAAGCLAERYGSELADALPEAQILSFDDYGAIGARLDAVLAGERRPRARAARPAPLLYRPGRAARVPAGARPGHASTLARPRTPGTCPLVFPARPPGSPTCLPVSPRRPGPGCCGAAWTAVPWLR